MSGYTKEPWRLIDHGQYIAICAGDSDGYREVCTLQTCWDDEGNSEQRANAQLVLVAPELLEALEHFASLPLEEFGWGDKKDDRPITGFNGWNLTIGHIRKARAAIRKAKGEA